MLNRILEYFQNHFGITPFKQGISSSSSNFKFDTLPTFSSKPKLKKASMTKQQKEILRLREVFMIGFSLFNSGDREEAIIPLQQVLNDPLKYPTYRMVAACMIGETFRGMGQFDQADDYYELSIHEANLIPDVSRRGNEWYEHYRPRATFGLITILRRTLSTNHNLIKQLLRDARDQYREYPNEDLMAQLNVVEGVYFRQLGDVESSVHRINAGIENTLLMAPPYLFWHPEHFQAMLLLSYLSDDGYILQASRLARKMVKEERNPWSNAVALGVSIKLSLKRIFNNYNSSDDKNISKSQMNKINDWLECLNKNILFEKDPFLTTETIVLETIWNALIGKEEKVQDEINQLIVFMSEKVSDSIWLLRAIELATIKGILLKNNHISKELLNQLWGRGANLLRQYTEALKSYGCSQPLIDSWYQLLTNLSPKQQHFNHFNSDAIRLLRLRLMP